MGSGRHWHEILVTDHCRSNESLRHATKPFFRLEACFGFKICQREKLSSHEPCLPPDLPPL